MPNLKIMQLRAGGLYGRALTAELRRCGADVITGDSSPESVPGAIAIPPMDDRGVFLQAIDQAGADVILPHNHDECLVLASAARGRPWRVLLPPPAVLAVLNNKRLLYAELARAGFPFLDVREFSRIPLAADWPIGYLAKPANGCGAAGIITPEQLDQEYVLQKRAHGQEYTVDLVCNAGEIIDFCARRRLRAHGGICVEAEVVGQDVPFVDTLRRFAHHFCLTGPMALQGFLEHDGRIYITDANPRFGGGVAMSLAAGWCGVDNFVKLANGDKYFASYNGAPLHRVRIRRWYTEVFLEEITEEVSSATRSGVR